LPAMPGSRFSKNRRLINSLRLLTPTFSKMLERCRWTVFSAIKSALEIPFVERPRTTSLTTSSSRGLRP
jgi:hypothetical protein